jgi:fluoroacetyl-CoA thioesterase
MSDEITPGIQHEIEVVASDGHSAEKFGNHGFPVFATPALVGLFERCAIEALAPRMSRGTGTVGTKIEVAHLAATPLGMKVRIHCELKEVERKKLVFELRAHDEFDLIATCRHERYVVDLESFSERLNAKKTRTG